ncbi:MAG: carboxypeptidase regulatory-like domain-containing protein [Planctomycetaceae bacterium]|nr:carboxypeptidase-like regulatory domain-containing protein [Planctomycetota bacterium]NUN53683.1 carboxypeptidase regulatory-like domain-containing protein [Planctomycetaceae bacterium]
MGSGTTSRMYIVVALIPLVVLCMLLVSRANRRSLPSHPPEHLVEGIVLDAQGRPVEGAFAWALSRNSPDPSLDVGCSDGAGRYRVHVSFSEGRVLVVHPDGRTAEAEIRRGGKDYWERITTPPTLERAVLARVPPLEGRVLDGEGRPAPGLVLEARVAALPGRAFAVACGDRVLHLPPARATSDGEGRFSLPVVLPFPHVVTVPSLEGHPLGIPGSGPLLEGGNTGAPGGPPLELRVRRVGDLPFSVRDAETGGPVRLVRMTFPPARGPAGFEDPLRVSYTFLDGADFLMDAGEQPFLVSGPGFRERLVEDLASLPRDGVGRFLVHLEPDPDAPLLRLRWDPALERGPGVVTLHMSPGGAPMDRLRPSPTGGAALLEPPSTGPLRWVFEAPGRALLEGEWDGREARRVDLAPPPEARILLRWKEWEASRDPRVALLDGLGRPLPFLASNMYSLHQAPNYFLQDPVSGGERHEGGGLGQGLLLGGLPAGEARLLLRASGKDLDRTLRLEAGGTVEIELP